MLARAAGSEQGDMCCRALEIEIARKRHHFIAPADFANDVKVKAICNLETGLRRLRRRLGSTALRCHRRESSPMCRPAPETAVKNRRER
jgi:hypothetical protein